jgi:hypothetical protein
MERETWIAAGSESATKFRATADKLVRWAEVSTPTGIEMGMTVGVRVGVWRGVGVDVEDKGLDGSTVLMDF